MYKKFFKQILPQRFFPVLMFLLQVVILLYTVLSSSIASQIAEVVSGLVSITACVYIVSSEQNSAFKISWIILVLLAPFFGITMYLLFNFQSTSRRFDQRVRRSCQEVAVAYALPQTKDPALPEPRYERQLHYLQQCGFPAYSQTQSRFLPLGETAFNAMLDAMEQAQHYIFLEFFIIEEGKMWNTILELLKRKAKDGITVRLIYDDLGCFFLLPADYPKRLQQFGIECAPFNPFRPALTAMQNNRDHRKILSVDGRIAFTGGINLADEYINEVEKFGHWKDTAVQLEGHGAWGLTAMFLQSWRLCTGTEEDPSVFYPWHSSPCLIRKNGLVQPYCDSPMDRENVGKQVYLHIIHSARRYLYICTPYLIIDDTLVESLVSAAKSGVDVRIITPHRWDKRLVHVTTRSYYRELIRGGVRIFEYTPGFIHSKTFVSDDALATVGTVNMDYRSLYLHFECGTCLYQTDSVMQIKQDTLDLLSQCQEITLQDCRGNLLLRLVQDVMRLFAPLM